jgi:hypothetical protein
VPGAVLRGVTLDCADPRTLAGFYGQPGDGRWRVLLDPAGHPFCLTSS